MWLWIKRFGLWFCLGLLFVSCQPRQHIADTPTPEPLDGCNLFADLHPPTLKDPAPLPDLPVCTRPPRYAAHPLFIDQTILHHVQTIGFDTVVQVLPWRDVNPEPAVWQWAAADALVEETLSHNLNLVLRLDMPPAWARHEAAAGVPFDVAAYAAFVERVAARYQGHLVGYIIWNEPNLAAEWSFSGANLERQLEIGGGHVAYPPHYAGVLGVAYARIHAADPQALVIAAGLAPTNENSLRAMDDRLFLEQLLAAQAADCFDVLSVHAYGYGQDPLAEEPADGLHLGRMADLHMIMMAHGVEKPVWITELGYTVNRGSQPAVSLPQQAAYLTAALERIDREWPWVTLTTIWNVSYGLPADDEIEGYSLLTNGVDKRPSYGAVQKYLEQVGGS
ncbi:MAG: hypothetical protein KDE51_22940 [Anaerolineales bacterium]|nr:hypothetical protein [Anaerolineales bacterium]